MSGSYGSSLFLDSRGLLRGRSLHDVITRQGRLAFFGGGTPIKVGRPDDFDVVRHDERQRDGQNQESLKEAAG